MLSLLFVEIWLGFPIKLENADTLVSQVPVQQNANQAQQKMKGVHLVESRKGERDWELFADAAEGFGAGQGKWKIQKVKILFYSKNEIQFTVTGLSGEIDTQTKDMKIEGQVRTISANGYRFESPMLLYMAKDRLLQSPAQVQMQGPDDVEGSGLELTAKSMRTYVGESEMNLTGQVVAKKKFKNGRQFTIRSEIAKFSGVHYRALFRDQVSLEYAAMKLQSPEASFQYKSGSSLLDFIQLGGGVKLSDLDKYATAELVRIEPETNRVVLTGSPRVLQNQDELLGDQIIFIDGGKKVKIEKMRARVEKEPGSP